MKRALNFFVSLAFMSIIVAVVTIAVGSGRAPVPPGRFGTRCPTSPMSPAIDLSRVWGYSVTTVPMPSALAVV